MKLAVCLLTCDRPDYTGQTLASFRAHNLVLPDTIFLHADDGSSTDANCAYAARYNFETVYRVPNPRGQAQALRMLWTCALGMGATHILHMENDWEWVRPLPLGLIAREVVDCVRLYGDTKTRDPNCRSKTGKHILGTKQRINWFPYGDDWERGLASWGGPPSVTEAKKLVLGAQLCNGRRLKDIALILNCIDTLKPKENYAWHIGRIPTPRRVV